MLSAPRYSAASSNANGEWAVYTSTNYSFETHEAATGDDTAEETR